MARKSSGAWFRQSKNAWYATIGGKKIPLGVKGRDNAAEAQRAWHRHMGGVSLNANSGREHTPRSSTAPPLGSSPLQAAPRLLREVGELPARRVPHPTPEDTPRSDTSGPVGPTCRQLVEAFLTGCEGRMAKGTARNYRIYLHEFLDAFADVPPLALTPHRVEDQARRVAADRKKQPKYGRASVARNGWSQTYTSNYLAAIQTCLRWCLKQRLLTTNPLAGMSKPPRTSRGADVVVTLTDHTRLLRCAPPFMADFLTILWNTGARPSEVASLTAEHLAAHPAGVIPLKAHKGAHRGKSRMLVVQGEAMDAARRRAAAVGVGLLFPSPEGQQLSIQALGQRLRTIARKAGLKATLYGYRHGYATEALSRGVPESRTALYFSNLYLSTNTPAEASAS